jgi:CAAX prenyl protease-like protein
VKNLVPHFLPYAAYAAAGLVLGAASPWADAARIVVAGAALVLFARRGCYPELRARPTPGQTLAGIAAGVAVGAAWAPLAGLVPPLAEGARSGLDPSADLARTALRIASMVLVVPVAEELLVRSAVPRLVDAHGGPSWRERPVGDFTWVSAAVSVLLFTLTHPEWLAALVTGVVWTALLARTRNLRCVVLSHAVANAWLAGHVLVSGDRRWW